MTDVDCVAPTMFRVEMLYIEALLDAGLRYVGCVLMVVIMN
jgi:hypothetical protein